MTECKKYTLQKALTAIGRKPNRLTFDAHAKALIYHNRIFAVAGCLFVYEIKFVHTAIGKADL